MAESNITQQASSVPSLSLTLPAEYVPGEYVGDERSIPSVESYAKVFTDSIFLPPPSSTKANEAISDRARVYSTLFHSEKEATAAATYEYEEEFLAQGEALKPTTPQEGDLPPYHSADFPQRLQELIDEILDKQQELIKDEIFGKDRLTEDEAAVKAEATRRAQKEYRERSIAQAKRWLERAEQQSQEAIDSLETAFLPQ